MTKKCNKCKKIKDVSEFYRRKTKSGWNYRYICRPCDNKLSNARRKAGGWKYEKKRQGPGSRHSMLSKITSQKHRDEMSDMYIRSLLTKKSKNLRSDDITDEMIQLCVANLKIKRQLRSTPKLKGEED